MRAGRAAGVSADCDIDENEHAACRAGGRAPESCREASCSEKRKRTPPATSSPSSNRERADGSRTRQSNRRTPDEGYADSRRYRGGIGDGADGGGLLGRTECGRGYENQD